MQGERKKRSKGAWEQSEGTKGSGRKQGGKRREKCLVVVGALLLMGQHELNTSAAIVYGKHYSKHESGENWRGREFDMEDVHNGLLCGRGRATSYSCRLYTHEYARGSMYHICTHASVVEIVSVNVFVSVYALKYGRSSSPNYDSDVSLEF